MRRAKHRLRVGHPGVPTRDAEGRVTENYVWRTRMGFLTGVRRNEVPVGKDRVEAVVQFDLADDPVVATNEVVRARGISPALDGFYEALTVSPNEQVVRVTLKRIADPEA